MFATSSTAPRQSSSPRAQPLLIDTEAKCVVACDIILAYGAKGEGRSVSVDLEWYTPERGTPADEGVRTPSTIPCFIQVGVRGMDRELLQQCAELLAEEGGDALLSSNSIVVFLVDLIALKNTPSLAAFVQKLMATPTLTKLFWDCREDCWVLTHRLKAKSFEKLFDVQLLHVLVTEESAVRRPGWHIGVTGLFKAMTEAGLADMAAAKDALADPKVFTERPLTATSIKYMCADAGSVLLLHERLMRQLPRNEAARDAMLEDARRGTVVYTTFSESVPDKSRRHGILAVGVLETLVPTPTKAVRCDFCTRVVAPAGKKHCKTCTRALEQQSTRRF